MGNLRADTLKLALSLAMLAGAVTACAQNRPAGMADNGASNGVPTDSVQTASAQAPETHSSSRDSLQQWLAQNGLVQQVSARASDLAINALSFLGVRYKYGGDHAATGFDCSGFVRHVYQQTLGLVLPHNAAQQSREGEKIAESQLKPGDLVFFNTLRRAFSHVGIYIGNGEFVHAPKPGQDVQIGNLNNPYWSRRFDGARRFITRAADAVPEAQAAPAAVGSDGNDAAGDGPGKALQTALPQRADSGRANAAQAADSTNR
uniref:Putative Cell wall-associated hydrolase n=1 Tax=mine drainage metagenome TaxID=410659 RepID=E6PWB3_9ZZZZ